MDSFSVRLFKVLASDAKLFTFSCMNLSLKLLLKLVELLRKSNNFTTFKERQKFC